MTGLVQDTSLCQSKRNGIQSAILFSELPSGETQDLSTSRNTALTNEPWGSLTGLDPVPFSSASLSTEDIMTQMPRHHHGSTSEGSDGCVDGSKWVHKGPRLGEQKWRGEGMAGGLGQNLMNPCMESRAGHRRHCCGRLTFAFLALGGLPVPDKTNTPQMLTYSVRRRLPGPWTAEIHGHRLYRSVAQPRDSPNRHVGQAGHGTTEFLSCRAAQRTRRWEEHCVRKGRAEGRGSERSDAAKARAQGQSAAKALRKRRRRQRERSERPVALQPIAATHDRHPAVRAVLVCRAMGRTDIRVASWQIWQQNGSGSLQTLRTVKRCKGKTTKVIAQFSEQAGLRPQCNEGSSFPSCMGLCCK